jgi:methanogenic corrinoid protein MtbC1
LLQILQTRDIDLLVHTMRATVLRLGLPHFVMEVAPALTTMVGEAWASAAITIADEHLFSDAMERLIAGEIAQIKQPAGRPRMLLTTPPGELHTLGLLMVEATARLQGAQCIALGAQTPLDQICLAVHDYQADIVGLSFSVAFAKRKIAPLLKDLRTMLPKEIELWAGGAGIVGLDRTPRGVSLFPHLQDVTRALKKIQKARLHLS